MASPKISPASTGRLVGLLVVGVLVLAGIGLFGVQLSHEEGAKALDASIASSDLLDEARSAQVTFKIQVQDWKNLLLRGHAAVDYDHYVARFGQDESAVEGILGRLAESPDLAEHLRTEVRAIAAEHARLGVSYREAIKQFRGADVATTFAVDASVRGIDQKLTQRIDAVAAEILAGEKSHATTLKAEFDRRYGQLRMTVMIATGVVLLLLGVVVWRLRAAR
jgi:hypothetical protein